MKICIRSKRFLKFTRRFQLSFGSGRKDVGFDVWSVILLKVDPPNIFKCILISKSCLKVITSPYFRRKYVENWKDSIKECSKAVIGFMQIGGEFQLLTTNQLGFRINNTKLIKGHHFEFKSKSSSGLILCADQETLYVFNFAPFGGSVIVTPLPPAPERFMFSMMVVIISSEDSSFKVVMAGTGMRETWPLTIQTFCSSTWTWQKSELSFRNCYRGFELLLNQPGIVGNRGMVYWPAKAGRSLFLAAYDTKNPNLCRIEVPNECYVLERYYFDSTPRGNVLCATTDYRVISILELDDESVERRYWNLLHKIVINSVWDANSASVLAGDVKNDDLPLFKFASFVPGRSDSIFVARRQCLFICNIHTKKLQRFEETDYLKIDCIFPRVYVPMTMAEVGMWPSSPFSRRRRPHSFPRTSFSLHGLICH